MNLLQIYFEFEFSYQYHLHLLQPINSLVLSSRCMVLKIESDINSVWLLLKTGNKRKTAKNRKPLVHKDFCCCVFEKKKKVRDLVKDLRRREIFILKMLLSLKW